MWDLLFSKLPDSADAFLSLLIACHSNSLNIPAENIKILIERCSAYIKGGKHFSGNWEKLEVTPWFQKRIVATLLLKCCARYVKNGVEAGKKGCVFVCKINSGICS